MKATWYAKRSHYNQGTLNLYASIKERSEFEQYLNLSNPKIWQTEARVSAHKFPIETGQYKNKNPTEGPRHLVL